MASRTITGTIYHPGGNVPWAGARITITLLSPFAVSTIAYPAEPITAVTAVDGTFSAVLAVPTTGTALYEFNVPNYATFRANIASGATVDLTTLISIVGSPVASTLAAIETHAAIKASTTVLGHVKIDGSSITIDGDGVISSIGGPPSGAAGGVLSGTYPDPGFAVDMATQAELDTHAGAADPHPGYLTPTEGNAAYQPLDSDLTAIALLSTTAYGRALLTLADAAALRTAGGLVIGTNVQAPATTLAGYGITDAASDSELAAHVAAADPHPGYLTPAEGNAAYQPLDSDLTSIAALTTTAYGRSFLPLVDEAAARTLIGLVAGGAGDIWVEKAGDTMTGALVITPTSAGADTFRVNDAAGVRVLGVNSATGQVNITATANALAMTGLEASARRDSVDSSGFSLTWRKTRASGACVNNDIVGDFSFLFRNSVNTEVSAALLRVFVPDVTAGAEDADFRIYTMDNGTLAVRYYFKSDGKLGVGKSAPVSMAHALALSAATIGIIAEGAASQTADLYQARDSALNVNWLIAATGAEITRPRDAVTGAVTTALTLGHNTSGTAGVGFGTGLAFQGESSTTENTDMARSDVSYVVATHASRTTRWSDFAIDFGGAREVIRRESSGTAAMLSFYGGAAVTQKAAITAPAGGATIDAEARTAIGLILTALGAAAGGIGITA